MKSSNAYNLSSQTPLPQHISQNMYLFLLLFIDELDMVRFLALASGFTW